MRRLPIADYPFGKPVRSLDERVTELLVRSTIESVRALAILAIPVAIAIICFSMGM